MSVSVVEKWVLGVLGRREFKDTLTKPRKQQIYNGRTVRTFLRQREHQARRKAAVHRTKRLRNLLPLK